ncbi:hypothetical protein [Nocardioides acrostichi]|uniref:Uncharacterized protein n=1 Tax=Nocardioides acrostichi TaxID=2784339 RepID=A0A930V028_9ACTN|nr:hypothetical protein [Nocardioides acrostichi]MBF4161267.1 hypothetical protein [Nocardioides acrostichi]
MRLALLPSPLTTSAVAEPLAEALRARGHEAVVACSRADDVDALLDAFVAAAAGADIVVPHSNAGRFGPSVAAAVGARLVCLDSLLPGEEDDASWTTFLREQERSDGLLAPWSRWWPRADVEAVVGPHWELLTSDEPRVPLRLLLEEPPVPAGWLQLGGGYVSFGDTYAGQAALVDRAGWVIRRIPGQHLHLLTAPDEVADVLLDAAVVVLRWPHE